MTELLKQEELQEYEAFVKSSPKGHFAQSELWARQKPDWDWQALICRDEQGKIRGTMALLFRKLPIVPGVLAYGCRGPVCDPMDGDTMRELLEAAKKLAAQHHAVVLKIDPDIPADQLYVLNLLTSMGFKPCAGGENFDQIQPKFVFRLNLQGKSEEELFQSFHQKTRYNIRLASRKGVTVRVCGQEMVEEFTRIMAETGRRDGFVTRQASYFSALLKNLGEHARLYMAFSGETPIAGTLAIQYGDKTWYLYGASSNEHRDLMPNYLLQWEMIRWAKEGNCRIYDFRGVSGDLTEDNPLYGLYRFKRGFNGEFTEFLGELDLVLRPLSYRMMQTGLRLYGKYKARRSHAPQS